MTSWESVQNYSPIIVMIIGVLTFAGYTGLGLLINDLCKISVPTPWRQVLSALIGILTVSLFVQMLGIAGYAKQILLIYFWITVIGLGSYKFTKELPKVIPNVCKKPDLYAFIPLIALAVALLTNLLVALAPCVRNDELHYHMLIPSRIVNDGEIKFYQQPWEGAIFPHMIFQIATAPLHALGYPDSGNVLSWSLSLILVWFGWYLLTENRSPPRWVYLCTAPIVVGYWSIVYYVTGGSQAFGDLSLAAAIAAFIFRDTLINKVGENRYSFFYSVLIISFVSSKATLAILGGFFYFILFFILMKSTKNLYNFFTALFYATIPLTVFYLPIVIWTYFESGSPFGPLFSNIFKGSVYDQETLKNSIDAWNAKYSISMNYLYQIKKMFIRHSPINIFAILGLLYAKKLRFIDRFTLLSIILLQIVCIIFLLPFETRYLGVIMPGILIIFSIYCPKIIKEKVSKNKYYFISVCCAFLIPWIAVQITYATQFLPISLGFQNKDIFYRKYISFYDDYKKIDNLLPNDAIILMSEPPPPFRMSSVYSPRPIYFSYHDLPKKDNVYSMFIHGTGNINSPSLPAEVRINNLVYKNTKALYTNLARIPGRTAQSLTLEVFSIEDKR